MASPDRDPELETAQTEWDQHKLEPDPEDPAAVEYRRRLAPQLRVARTLCGIAMVNSLLLVALWIGLFLQPPQTQLRGVVLVTVPISVTLLIMGFGLGIRANRRFPGAALWSLAAAMIGLLNLAVAACACGLIVPDV